eukprot:352248-Chlamydomonas_euryale.AAC.4
MIPPFTSLLPSSHSPLPKSSPPSPLSHDPSLHLTLCLMLPPPSSSLPSCSTTFPSRLTCRTSGTSQRLPRSGRMPAARRCASCRSYLRAQLCGCKGGVVCARSARTRPRGREKVPGGVDVRGNMPSTLRFACVLHTRTRGVCVPLPQPVHQSREAQLSFRLPHRRFQWTFTKVLPNELSYDE